MRNINVSIFIFKALPKGGALNFNLTKTKADSTILLYKMPTKQLIFSFRKEFFVYE